MVDAANQLEALWAAPVGLAFFDAELRYTRVNDSLAELAELWGHEAEVAHDGPTAIQKARARPPDVILCDIGLPGMDGYEVARRLRSDAALRSAHLVAVSGYAQPDDLRQAAEAGFDRHLAKPPDLEELQRLLA